MPHVMTPGGAFRAPPGSLGAMGFGVPGWAHPMLAPAEWAALARPGLPMHWAVLDVAGGPGTRPDAACLAATARLREAGVTVLGHLEMWDGTRSFGELVSDAHRYLDWYGVDGFYLARCPGGPAQLEETARTASTLRALCAQQRRYQDRYGFVRDAVDDGLRAGIRDDIRDGLRDGIRDGVRTDVPADIPAGGFPDAGGPPNDVPAPSPGLRAGGAGPAGPPRPQLVFAHGRHPHSGYADIADQLVTFSGCWTEYRWSQAAEWTAAHPPERFCHLVHGVPRMHIDEALRVARWQGAGTVWFTDHSAKEGHNPWEALPGYWDELVSRFGPGVSE